MNALEIVVALGATAALAVMVCVWRFANTLEVGFPPAPPDDPPREEPEIKPSDPFDALLVDLELFRLTNMTHGPKEAQEVRAEVPDHAAIGELDPAQDEVA